MAQRAALFLDRDGVINVDRAYVHRPQDFDFIEGIFDLCRNARQHDYLVFVVTNQAGIARGFYTEDDFLQLTRWMCGEFERRGAIIDKVYFCPFHAEHGIGPYKRDSPLRKPAPGMILQAAQEFDVDLGGSVLVGDMETDIQAGIGAGVGINLLFRPLAHAQAEATAATRQIDRLADVCAYLKRRPRS